MKKLMAVVLLFALPVYANRLSEAMIMHEDAVLEVATAQGSSVGEMSTPQFSTVTGNNHFSLVSNVEFIKKSTGTITKKTCTSQFEKTGERSFEITATECL
ncbi:MAG: hypothetical protein JSU04_04080 [Bdellovibrionales bacterium]|nr:hypothetical protein [Bdellovibrionales bacterium]